MTRFIRVIVEMLMKLSAGGHRLQDQHLQHHDESREGAETPDQRLNEHHKKIRQFGYYSKVAALFLLNAIQLQEQNWHQASARLEL